MPLQLWSRICMLIMGISFLLPASTFSQGRKLFSLSELLRFCQLHDRKSEIEQAGYDYWPQYSNDSVDFFMQPMVSNFGESAILKKQKTPFDKTYNYLSYIAPKQFEHQVEWFNHFNKTLKDSGFIYKSYTDTSAFFISKDSLTSIIVGLKRKDNYQMVDIHILQVYYIVDHIYQFEIPEMREMNVNWDKYDHDLFMFQKGFKKTKPGTYIQNTKKGDVLKIVWNLPRTNSEPCNLDLYFSKLNDVHLYRSKFVRAAYMENPLMKTETESYYQRNGSVARFYWKEQHISMY